MANNEMQYEVGSQVRFLGYDDNVAEKDRILEADGVYEVVEIDETGEEPILVVSAPNPSFDSSKRASSKNLETLKIDVYLDEVEPAEEEEAPEEKPAAKATRRATGKAAKEEEAPAESKPAAKGKAAAKAAEKTESKPAAKGKAVAKGKAEVAGKAASKPAKAAKGAKEEKEPEHKFSVLDAVLENEDEEIKELCEEAEDILALATETVEDASAIEYKLGGILYHVHGTKAYQDLDERYKQVAKPAEGQLSGFQLYCQEQLGFEYRKAMNLIEIYVNFNLAGIDGAKVAEIGWTKASKIASLMSQKLKKGEEVDAVAKVAEELVATAEESTVSELVDAIKETYASVGGTPGERKKVVLFKFKLFEDQADGVKQVLEATAAALGFKKIDQAFEHIVMEWAAEHPLEGEETKETKAASVKTAARASGRSTGRAARASARA